MIPSLTKFIFLDWPQDHFVIAKVIFLNSTHVY